jgi:hypothetical protein
VSESRLSFRQRFAIQASSVLFALLLLVWIPLFLLYSWAVCLLAWLLWVSPKHNVIVVSNGEVQIQERLGSVLSNLNNRAVFLDYAERRHWRSSIPGQLFRCFGPQPTTAIHVPGFLPTVIVVQRFRKPAHFSLGQRFVDHESALASLQQELAKNTISV